MAEERSIALHRAVADKLRANPALIERARTRVRRWRLEQTAPVYYLDRWEQLLSLELGALCSALVDTGEDARAMRQVSPFAGFLAPRERWQIWRAVRTEAGGPHAPSPREAP